MNLLEDLAANLRKPDCDHQHLSFPDADVSTIIGTLLRHRDEALEILNPSKPSLFGRERAMIDALTKHVHAVAKKRYEYSIIRERRRGSEFEVRMDDGRIAKITVEFDRIEEP